jgi:hypothetical protein
LSEAIVLRLAEPDDLDHVRATTAQLAQALSALGQVIAGLHATGDIVAGIASPGVPAPLALLNRAARYLEADAAMVRDEGSCRRDSTPPTQLSLPAPLRLTRWRCATTVTAHSRGTAGLDGARDLVRVRRRSMQGTPPVHRRSASGPRRARAIGACRQRSSSAGGGRPWLKREHAKIVGCRVCSLSARLPRYRLSAPGTNWQGFELKSAQIGTNWY